jgi:hypothetical protein
MKEITQDQADEAIAYAIDAAEAAPFDVRVELTDHGPGSDGLQNMLAGMRELGMHDDADSLEKLYNDVINETIICQIELRKGIDPLNKKIKVPARKFAKKAQKTWY